VSDKLAHLNSLARLTRENSDESRQQLLHEVTDLFMQSPDALTEKEIAYFGDIMGGIVVQVESMVRRHLSETISTVGNAPHNLVVALANDEIEVALPVLTNSNVLKDDDLVRIVEKHSQEYLQAISKRAVVTEVVTDALVKKGDDTVLGNLADNRGARFSENGMDTIVERARNNDELNGKLLARGDMPDDLSQDMFWRVSWAMREQILGVGDELDKTQIDALMAEAETWFEEQKSKRPLDPAENFVTRKEKLGQLNDSLLLELIRQDKLPEFVAGLARLAKIETETARQAVFDPTAEKLAIICKALDINYDVFGEFLFTVDFDGVRSPEETEDILGIYNRITPRVAQKALRFLRTRLSLRSSL